MNKEHIYKLRERATPWLTHLTILTCLLLGIVFACSHHAFYAHLAGTPASDHEYRVVANWSVSNQQLNIAIGTAFAFLVKSALGAAISIAYAQLFWRQVKRISHAVPLASVDNAFSALASPIGLVKIWTWKEWPLLFGVAALIWCVSAFIERLKPLLAKNFCFRVMPLTSIIPPATLSVENARVQPPPSRLLQVQNVNFASLDFANPLISGASDDDYSYDGPSQAVAAVAKVVSSQGDLMPIQSPEVNASWTLNFPGPVLDCNYVPEDVQSRITKNVASAMAAQSTRNCKYYGFVSWSTGVGWSGAPACEAGNALPFNLQQNSSSPEIQTGCFSSFSNTSVGFYMSLMPKITSYRTNSGTCFDTSENEGFFNESTTIKCELKNSSYMVDFAYPNGAQHIKFTASKENTSPVYALGSIRVDSSKTDNECNKLPWTNAAVNGQGSNQTCLPDEAVLRTLSYQAILDAFSYLFIGSLYTKSLTPKSQTTNQNWAADSELMYTALGYQPELQYLSNRALYRSMNNSMFESTFTYDNGTEILGLYRDTVIDSPLPFTEAIEKLFEKVVISMMSPNQLQ